MTILARSTDPQSSASGVPDAARLSYLRYRALQIFAANADGLIPDEVEVEARIKGIWRRCSDLKTDGLVEVVYKGVVGHQEPRTRLGRSGKCGEVLRITQAGHDVLALLEENPPKPRSMKKRSRSLDQRLLALIEEWQEPAESLRGMGTDQNRMDRDPRGFVKAIKKEIDA